MALPNIIAIYLLPENFAFLIIIFLQILIIILILIGRHKRAPKKVNLPNQPISMSPPILKGNDKTPPNIS